MLKKLHIVNFQAHASLALNFHPNVNVIIGPSNVGKTAVIRALRWLVFNKPSGDAFRKWGSETTSVTGYFDNFTARRQKDDKNNTYTIRPDKKTITFNGFGMNVPDRVSNLLNLHPINFQEQLDSPFLITDSPPEAARKLNEVANLESIGKCTQLVNARHRETNTFLNREKRELKRLQQELKGLRWVDVLDAELQSAKRTDNILKGKYKGLLQLQQIIKKLEDITPNLTTLQIEQRTLTQQQNKLESLVAGQQELDVLKKHFQSLQDAIHEIQTTNARVIEKRAEFETKQNKYNRLMPDECPLCESPIT